MTRHPIARAVPLALLLAGALAGPAAAGNYCVNAAPSTCSGSKYNGDLQGALTAAALSDTADTVHIGPGQYPGTYVYLGDNDTVQGAGPGKTILTSPSGAEYATLMTFKGKSELRDMTLLLQGDHNTALKIDHGTARRVAVEQVASATSASGIDARDARVADAQVSLLVPESIAAVQLAGSSTVSDATIKGSNGVVSQGGSSVVRRTRIEARTGILVPGDSLTVEDTLVEALPFAGSAGAVAFGAAGPTKLLLRQSTVVGHKGWLSTGVQASAYGVGKSSVRMENSIVAGFDLDLRRDATALGSRADLDVAWSRLKTAFQSGPGTGALTMAHVVTDAPGFAEGYRLPAGSPLVDAGDPAALAADESTTDLDGKPRVVAADEGGTPRRDLGAFETGSKPAPAVPQPPSPQTPSPQTPDPQAPDPEAPQTHPVPPVSVDPGLPLAALGLELSGAKRQPLGRRLTVTARPGAAATLRATAVITAGRKRLALPGRTAQVASATETKIRVPVPPRTLRTIRAALAGGRKVTATIKVTATANDGRTASASRVVRVTR